MKTMIKNVFLSAVLLIVGQNVQASSWYAKYVMNSHYDLKLSSHHLTLGKDESFEIYSIAENLDFATISWKNLNPNVITLSDEQISSNYNRIKVTPKSLGEATIVTYLDLDKTKTDTCHITVHEAMIDVTSSYRGHEYVDLGLPSGLMWAVYNMGADALDKAGDRYSWGETTTKAVYTLNNYQYYKGPENPSEEQLSNSSNWVSLPKDIAGTQYDAARVNWGGAWRMPTIEEYEELVNYCYNSSVPFDDYPTTNTLYSKNTNRIVFPMKGFLREDEEDDRRGNIMLSSLYNVCNEYAGYGEWDGSCRLIGEWPSILRWYGVPVRPVFDPSLVISLAEGEDLSLNNDKTISTLTYTRTATSYDWEPLYLPFSSPYELWKNDYEVARINAFHQYDDDEDGTIDRSVLEAVKVKKGNLMAKFPYLVRAKKLGETRIVQEDVKLYGQPGAPVSCSTVTSKFNFQGTFQAIEGTTLTAQDAYTMQDGALRPATASMSLPAYRWYMTIEDRQDGNTLNASAIRVMVYDATETGIENIENDQPSCDLIYDLSGRQVKAQQVSNGLYLKNGKKYIAK